MYPGEVGDLTEGHAKHPGCVEDGGVGGVQAVLGRRRADRGHLTIGVQCPNYIYNEVERLSELIAYHVYHWYSGTHDSDHGFRDPRGLAL
jgi:hypothetical protein